MINGADLYLDEWLGRPQAYDALDETEQAFKQIATRNLTKTDNAALREVTRKFDFLLVEKRGQIETRAYELINNIEANPELFLDTIAGELSIDLTPRPDAPGSKPKINFDDDEAIATKDFGALTRFLEQLDGDARSEAARVVEQVSIVVGEQGKKKDQAALKFAKMAHGKLAAIDLRYANRDTYAELRTILSGCVLACENLIASIDGN